ncbi:phage holin family protein [Actinoplanes sichuanensis]|uniref:Phage holin family protein n=1 Tax=Actinoplanes sichuanensis TaxID=512349 RepID=A0ABW4AJ13_9ACTN|nr:phage holin family protein [Actinoplanes sichuanensis]BEL03796.1 phage holin family protein [Actinoplanes sichuanensis]
MVRALVTVIVGAMVTGVVIGLLPGISADDGWAVLTVAIVLGVLGAVLRPLLVTLLTRIGWAGVVAGWIVVQGLLVWIALQVTPGIQVDGFWSAFWASWLGAILMSIGLWVVTAGQHGVATRHLLRANRRYRRSVAPTDVPGVIMIQIDGLSAPLTRWAIETGNLPTIGRWLRTGSHTLTEWHARMPATTPASQAGLLHGASDRVPAFRWYEKTPGRLVVTNRPEDAALVESRLSNGRGLLADGGVSVSNVFSGDAPTSLLTMSTVRGRRPGPARYLSAYLLDPFGLTRSLVLAAGEIVKELHQARRQRLRGVEPRMHRDWRYVLLRGATNVLLRNLNLTVIAEQMMRGAPAVFCDLVDYDEIAHHAGPARPEALASLDGIDGVLAILEEVAAAAPRPYRFVILSDHGQSQGATFRQRYGLTLEDLIRGQGTDDVVVAAGGNLALVYFTRLPCRVTREQIDKRYPELLPTLTGHAGIGWVMVRSEADGAVVLGPDGQRRLRDDHVDGTDPLAGFGPHAADDLRRHDTLDHTGDLVINSLFDPVTGEVAAFEELIGCHGGLGGAQEQPVLVHPREWRVTDPLIGSDAVHLVLCGWLEQVGCRSSAGGEPPRAPR